MLQEFLQLLPDNAGNAGAAIAAIGAFVGLLLWVLGTKTSRPLITLLTVSAGAVVGQRLPVWFNWEISGAGPTVGGAVVMGVSGYVLHRMWVGIGLGGVLAFWSALVTWIAMHGQVDWTWPATDVTTTIWSYLPQLWQQVPPEMTRILPFVCSAAVVSGVAFTILWPKLATVLSWSMIGATMMASMGIAAIAFARPQWLASITDKTWIQVVTLIVMTAIGAAIQWKLMPRKVASGGGEERKSEKPKEK